MASLLAISWGCMHDAAPARSKFYDKWINGDGQIDEDLQFVTGEKSDNMNLLTDIIALKHIAESFHNTLPKGPRLTGAAEQIMVDELALLEKQVAHDVDCLAVWKGKCTGAETNAHAALRKFAIDQVENLKCAADTWMKKHLRFLTWSNDDDQHVNQVINGLMNFRAEVAAPTGLDIHTVRLVPLINWCSPSTHPADSLKSELQLLSWCIAENAQNVGLVLMPVHSNHKNKLVLAESTSLGKLQKCNFTIDHQFCVLFDDRVDGRDARPLMYPGRFVFPGSLVHLTQSIWWSSKLRTMGRTDFVKQLPGKDMIVPEDLDESALPKDEDHRYASGGKKYEQLGPSAAEELVRTLLADAQLSAVSAIIFVCPTALVGDEIQALIAASQNSGTRPLYAFCVSDSPTEKLFLEEHIELVVAAKIKEKKLVVRGMVPVLDTPPPDSILGYSSQPDYQVLIPHGKVAQAPGTIADGEVLPADCTLEMPVALFKKWSNHGVHGQQFRAMMEQHELSVVADMLDSPAKAAATVAAPGQPPLKKQCLRVDPAFIVNTDSVTAALLHEAKVATLTKGDLVKLQLRFDAIYAVNTGTSECTLQKNMFLGGWGKGAFKLLRMDDTLPVGSIEFKMTSSEELVVLNNAVQKLGDIPPPATLSLGVAK
jgi:hypothetical protein